MIAVVFIILALTILVAIDDDAPGNSDDAEPRSLAPLRAMLDESVLSGQP
jgi:hypothetical protein